MKKITMITLIALCLSACTNNEDTDENEIKSEVVMKIQTESGISGEIKPNYIGGYSDHYVNIFAGVVNGNTRRQVTGEVFNDYFLPREEDLAVEVFPGSTYEPDFDFPKLPEGYYAEILFEEVDKHAEKPKELYFGTATSSDEGIVDIPNKPGAYFRYTMRIYNEIGELKDVYYKPLFTTFDDYNFVMNVRKPIYEQDEKITLNIENWGPNYISFNNDWKLFKQNGEEWKLVDDFLIEPLTINDVLIVYADWVKQLKIEEDSGFIGSGRNESIILNHNPLEKGNYKIQGTIGSKKHVFTVEDVFEVR